MKKWLNMPKTKVFKMRNFSKEECRDRSAIFWVRRNWNIELVSSLFRVLIFMLIFCSIKTWGLEPRWLLVKIRWGFGSNFENRTRCRSQRSEKNMAQISRFHRYNRTRIIFGFEWKRLHRKIWIWFNASDNSRRGRKLERTQRLVIQ